jgi:hypothetical protein
MERLYAEADKQALTEAQRKRLKMMGDNLVVLHWNLRNAGLLKETQKSVFFREDKTFRQFMADRADSLAFVDLSFYRKWRWQTILWAPETRALEIAALPQGAAAPQIDGDLGDEAWARAGVADQFRLNEDERQPAGEQTVARALYDDKNLYLSWQCSAAEPGRLRSACAIANSVAIFSDDVVEAYIQPDRQTVVHAAMNPAGVLFVQPETPAQGAAKVGNDFWSAEMAIPLQALRPAAPPRPGDAWRGNLARRKVGPPIQHSAWNRVEERLGDERAFGVWRFGGKP